MRLTKWDVYAAWAPEDSIWSQWAKPVVFANLPPERDSDDSAPDAVGLGDAWLPRSASEERNTAWVIDLPGAESVAAAIELSRLGYRPVPLFNGAPPSSAKRSAVDTGVVARALRAGAPELLTSSIAKDAPPAFMLDSQRMPKKPTAHGTFDNRWITLPQDYPSARFLLAADIHFVCVVQKSDQQLPEDLIHVLRRWQDAGIRISVQPLTGTRAPIRLSKPSFYRSLFYRTLARIGLRRNSAGGFGALIPEPSEGSGFVYG